MVHERHSLRLKSRASWLCSHQFVHGSISETIKAPHWAYCLCGRRILTYTPLIARFMRPTWGPSGAHRIQVGPMLAPWTLLSGTFCAKAGSELVWCKQQGRQWTHILICLMVPMMFLSKHNKVVICLVLFLPVYKIILFSLLRKFHLSRETAKLSCQFIQLSHNI